MISPDNSDAPERYGWPINDWAKAAGISRASAYVLLGNKDLKSVKYRSRRLITTHPRDWLRSLANGEAA